MLIRTDSTEPGDSLAAGGEVYTADKAGVFDVPETLGVELCRFPMWHPATEEPDPAPEPVPVKPAKRKTTRKA